MHKTTRRGFFGTLLSAYAARFLPAPVMWSGGVWHPLPTRHAYGMSLMLTPNKKQSFYGYREIPAEEFTQQRADRELRELEQELRELARIAAML